MAVGQVGRAEVALARDQARLHLARPPALADHEVAQEARLVLAVPGREALLAAPGLDGLAHLVDALGGEHVVGHVVDQVEAAGAVEAEHQLAVLGLAEGVLELVAVAPCAATRGHDRLDRRRLEAAEALERLAHLVLLLLELALVGQHLPGRAGVRALDLDPLRARLDQLDRLGLRERALGLAEPRPDQVAGHRAAHEHHVAVRARDAGAAVGERVDAQLEHVAAPGLVVLAVSIGYLCWQPHGSGRVQGRGRAVRLRDRPRVLPALLGAEGRLRDRADLRAARRAVLPRIGRAAARERQRPAARVRRQGADRPGDQGGHRGAGAPRGGARDRGRRRDDAVPRGDRAPGQLARPGPARRDRGGAQRRHRHRAQPAAESAARACPRAGARSSAGAATWRCARSCPGST